jgi:iron complex outermembrane receptor protein
VTLSFGARFDEVEFDVTDRFLSDGDDSGVVTLDDVSPMVGIAVDLTDRVSVYGTYSSAFETPTTTEFNRPDGGGGFNDALNPQVARNLEVGLRGRAGDRSRYEIAVFNIKVDDELIPFEVPTAPGRDYFDNAGESSRNGVEFSFSSSLSDRLSAMLSYTYADYEYDSFVDDGGNNFGGNRIPGTAEDVFFGNLSYNHPRGWYAAFDLNYVGDQFVNNANSVSSDSYTLGNLRFGWEHDRNSLVIAPFVGINNLFDETYTDNVRINSFGGRYFEPGPERNIYAGVSLRFN